MGFDVFLRKCFGYYEAVYSNKSHVIFIPLEHSSGILYDLCKVFQKYRSMDTSSYIISNLVGIDAITEVMFLDFPKSGMLSEFGFGLQSFADMCRMLEFESQNGILSGATSGNSVLYSLCTSISKQRNCQ